jgi:hypothetical protein
VDPVNQAKPTFIVGHPRSGTSLLRSLLDGHPDLMVLPFESHLFDWVADPDPVSGVLDRTRLWPTLNRREPSLAQEEVRTALQEAFSKAGDPRTRLLALVEGWGKLQGVPSPGRWVEKTPRHLFEVPTFLRWFPHHCRILVVRRDPRDVMASALKQRASRPIFGMALSARVSHQITQTLQKDRRVHTVFYEQLVGHAEEAMEGISEFLEIPMHPTLLRPTVLGAPYEGNSRFETAFSGISPSPVGRYQTQLSPSQLRQAEALLAPILSGDPYAPSTDEGSPSGWKDLPSAGLMTALVKSGLWKSRRIRSLSRGF